MDSFSCSNVMVSARELPSIGVNVISSSSYVLLGLSTLRSIRKQAIFYSCVQNSSMEDPIFYQPCLQSSQDSEFCLKDWRRLSHLCCCSANTSFYASMRVPKLLSMAYTSRLICRESRAAWLCLSQYTCTLSANSREYTPSNFSLTNVSSLRALSTYLRYPCRWAAASSVLSANLRQCSLVCSITPKLLLSSLAADPIRIFCSNQTPLNSFSIRLPLRATFKAHQRQYLAQG